MFSTSVFRLLDNWVQSDEWGNTLASFYPTQGIQVNDPKDPDRKLLKYELDMPGVKKDDLVVEVANVLDGNVLKVTGQRSSGRVLGFTITVPHGFDVSKTDATLENGVLILLVEPVQKSVQKRIAIR